MSMYINTVHEFIECLRQGSYSSVGSYPLYFVCSDGETLSTKSAHDNALAIGRAIRDKDVTSQWHVVAHDVNWEDSDMYCAHSNERIPSAYAEDEADTIPVDSE